RQHADQVAHEQRPRERRPEALRHVEEHDRNPVAPPEAAPHVRRPDVPAPERADVDAAPCPHDPVARGNRPGEVAAGDAESGGECVAYGRIWDLETQSLIVDQSRLSKKASMYEARSVW